MAGPTGASDSESALDPLPPLREKESDPMVTQATPEVPRIDEPPTDNIVGTVRPEIPLDDTLEFAAVINVRVLRAIERSGVPFREFAKATGRSKKALRRRLRPKLLSVDDLYRIGKLLGDLACIGLWPNRGVERAELEVLEVVREMFTGQCGADRVNEAYARLVAARVVAQSEMLQARQLGDTQLVDDKMSRS